MDSRTPKPYLSDSCEQCGTCLTLCPVMRLEPAEAKREIANLREGRPSRVLKECTTCLDCDFFCPNGCNPGELIINRFGEVVRERGLPERARFFMPHSPVNFRTFVLDGMTPREKEIVESWRDMSPADEVCYPGCNMIATPLLTQTSALDGLDIRGGLEFCCGEMYWRMGMFDKLEEVARKTQAYFDALGASKVTILCSAGYYMFTEVLPHFGADYKFEMVSYLEVLDRKLEAGELKIRKPLDMTVTIQESCYGKQFGHDYLALPRRILERAGAQVIEMGCSGECMLCCGIGAGFSPYSAYNPLRLVPYTVKVMREAGRTGADAIVTYCSGCLQMFSTGKLVYPFGPPVYHVLELLGMALGETPEKWHGRFARRMLAGTLLKQGPALLSPRRFKSSEIDIGA
ncbi:MAG TPA: (Fe-S)-binding protein [Candidatus Anoxymicrobiaceae bacterium]